MREMDVVGIRFEEPDYAPVLVLRERDGGRYVPIWIGAAEAGAISLRQQGVEPSRPLTHDLLAAVLRAQLEHFQEIQAHRHRVWDRYARDLVGWAGQAGATLMHVPDDAEHPAHVFYLLMPDHDGQLGLLRHLKEHGIVGTFHYQPLDSSPAGRRLGRTPAPCTVTADVATRLVRLPLWAGMSEAQVSRVVDGVTSFKQWF